MKRCSDMEAVVAATVACGSLAATTTAGFAATAPTATAAATTAAAAFAESVALENQNKDVKPNTMVAWDAMLDNPGSNCTQPDPNLCRALVTVRRAALSLIGDKVDSFLENCELISLGCYCSTSYGLQLLGLKRNSYPFDWVRCSLDGIIHCLELQFQDFLTYSTHQAIGDYIVFGGTRWGGSFWHHNLEAPVTRTDMIRRVQRFFGDGSVSSDITRIFIRAANSTREITAAVRLRNALVHALPQVKNVYLLLMLELQPERGPIVISGKEGEGLLFYSFTEEEFRQQPAAGAHPLSLSAGRYAEAAAFAVRYWAGATRPEELRVFETIDQLDFSADQWDGGDPGRELFTPRRFYGQRLDGVSLDERPWKRLIASTQVQYFTIPPGVDCNVPFQVQCFGKHLRVQLPEGTQGGHLLYLYLHVGALSASVCVMAHGQLMNCTQAPVWEELPAVQTPAGQAP